MNARTVCALAIVPGLCVQARGQPELVVIQRSRDTIATGLIEYERIEEGFPQEAGKPTKFTSRIAGSSVAVLPDWKHRLPDGGAATPGTPFNYLRTAESVALVNRDNGCVVFRAPDQEKSTCPNVRWPEFIGTEFQEPPAPTGPVKTSRDGSKLTMEYAVGAGFVKLIIATDMGFSITRVECRRVPSEEPPAWSVDSVPVNVGGVWFPKTVALKSGRKAARLNVIRAEFNRPGHPRQLTPHEIGAEYGKASADDRLSENKQGMFVPGGHMAWRAFERARTRGWLPDFGKLSTAQTDMLSITGSRYHLCALAFIQRYHLDSPKTQAALGIATDIETRHKREKSDPEVIIIAELEPRLESLLTSEDAARAKSRREALERLRSQPSNTGVTTPPRILGSASSQPQKR